MRRVVLFLSLVGLIISILMTAAEAQDSNSVSDQGVTTTTVDDDTDLQECIAFTDITQYSSYHLAVAGYTLESEGYYFCADTAPKRYQCKCSSSTVCLAKLDPFGRNLGECGCCQGWIWAVLGFLLLAIFVGLVFCLYACMCRGRWWCDGHPKTVQPILPRRAPPTVLPSTVPIPSAMFRGYRPADFESGLPPGVPQERARTRSSSQGANPPAAAARRSGSTTGATTTSGARSGGGRGRTVAQGGGTAEEMVGLTSGGSSSPAGPSSSGPSPRRVGSGLLANNASNNSMGRVREMDREMQVISPDQDGSFSGTVATAIQSAGTVPLPPTEQEEA